MKVFMDNYCTLINNEQGFLGFLMNVIKSHCGALLSYYMGYEILY